MKKIVFLFCVMISLMLISSLYSCNSGEETQYSTGETVGQILSDKYYEEPDIYVNDIPYVKKEGLVHNSFHGD